MDPGLFDQGAKGLDTITGLRPRGVASIIRALCRLSLSFASCWVRAISRGVPCLPAIVAKSVVRFSVALALTLGWFWALSGVVSILTTIETAFAFPFA